jgi:hypothetical protein
VSEAASFRGQPLLVLVGVLCAWFGLRVALWQSAGGADPMAVGLGETIASRPARWAESAPAPPLGSRGGSKASSLGALAGRATWPESAPSRRSAAVGRASARSIGGLRPEGRLVAIEMSSDPARLAAGHSLLLAAGLSQLRLPLTLTAVLQGAASPRGVPAAVPLPVALPPTGSRRPASRLLADAWIFVRQDTVSAVVSGLPSYGRSQAGGTLRYRLAPSSSGDPQAYVRASSALEGALERDLAVGLSARPVRGLPVRFAAELRATQTAARTELRPAITAASEFPRLALPHSFRADAYLQGGYVGGRFATAFADGQGRVERPIARFANTEVAAGAGAWGGAQRGAARLDVGPTATVSVRLGAIRGQLAADYRLRVAGGAQPNSGPAFTLSAGF